MSATILFEQHQGVARISFNRADKHNALGHQELAGIEAALDSLDETARVVILTSQSGRTFCAGADLQQINNGELSGERFQAMTNRIAALPIPTLCVINGNIFGGGVELAVSCDFRVAADDVMMRVPAAAIGLCYPIDGIERLVKRLGVALAKRILVAAEEFSAADMKSLGILAWTAPASELMLSASQFAEQLASQAPLAVRAMLQVIDQVEQGQLDRSEADRLVALCAGSADLKEGLLAQRERRAPQFTGE